MYKFIKYIILFFLVLTQLHSKINWENQIEEMKFSDLTIFNNLMDAHGKYFLFYYGKNLNNIEGKIYGYYPALLSFDKDGNLLFRKEEPIPFYDSLKAHGYISTLNLSEFYSTEDEINLVILKGSFPTYSPNYFRFSSIDGMLKTIDGSESNLSQFSSLETVINNNDLFVLSSYSLNSKDEASIIVNSLYYVNNYSFKYRILLNHAPFTDKLLSDLAPGNLIFINDSTFFVFYLAKDNKTNIIAKYSYNRDSANTLPRYSSINANLLNYTVYKAKSNEGIRNAYNWHNGNYLAMHYKGGIVMFNENAEIIYNDLPFANSSYDNFSLAFILPLKKKPGYYALYGTYNDNGNYNFAIVIADSLWNKVDEFVWDYGGNYNLLEDMVESDDGNLIVYGKTSYFIDGKGLFKSYYASVHFDILSGVEDNNNVNNEIIVQPNPATEYITVNLSSINPTLKRGVEGEVFIEIYDVMGMKIQSTPFNLTPALSEEERARIDISNLTPGVYFVKIGDRVEKFVKY